MKIIPFMTLETTLMPSLRRPYQGSDETVSISEAAVIVDLRDGKTIFSLSGQRLSKPQKGINIINGRKVYVK